MVDELLIKRIRAGDEDASEILVRKYYLQIMRFCMWQCGNADLAEDLAQETFLKAFKSLDQYRKKGHFKAWLYSVAKSVCIDEFRKRRIESETTCDIYELGSDSLEIKRLEDDDEIRHMMANLPEDQKEALLLHYIEGFSYRQMGEILNIPYRTAQSRVNLAIKTLREKGKI